MNTFETALTQIKTALNKSQGADVTVELNAKDGRAVRVRAFTAGGNVKPGSFRSKWFIDGVQFSKANAAKELVKA